MSKDIKKDTFIETNSQYGGGMCLDDYNDIISICNAHPGDDQIWLEWMFPQGKDRKPIEKGLPWKVTLGKPLDAIHRLRSMASTLEEIYVRLADKKPTAIRGQRGTTSPASGKKTGLASGNLTIKDESKEDVPF
jgi:hypothetical protein